MKLSVYYEYMKLRRYAALVAAPEGDPVAAVTFDRGTLKKHDHGKKRVGRPRLNWVEETQEIFWNRVCRPYLPLAQQAVLNLNRPAHRELIRERAKVVHEDKKVLMKAVGLL